jgi:hypothetical protein
MGEFRSSFDEVCSSILTVPAISGKHPGPHGVSLLGDVGVCGEGLGAILTIVLSRGTTAVSAKAGMTKPSEIAVVTILNTAIDRGQIFFDMVETKIDMMWRSITCQQAGVLQI